MNATVLNGKVVAAECRDATGLGADVVLGLNRVPDATKVKNVRSGLASAAFSEEEDFLSFCGAHGLTAHPGNAESAARFLAFTWRQALAWLHFPQKAAACVWPERCLPGHVPRGMSSRVVKMKRMRLAASNTCGVHVANALLGC